MIFFTIELEFLSFEIGLFDVYRIDLMKAVSSSSTISTLFKDKNACCLDVGLHEGWVMQGETDIDERGRVVIARAQKLRIDIRGQDLVLRKALEPEEFIKELKG